MTAIRSSIWHHREKAVLSMRFAENSPFTIFCTKPENVIKEINTDRDHGESPGIIHLGLESPLPFKSHENSAFDLFLFCKNAKWVREC